MGWLLELLFGALKEMCSQFIVDMMDIAVGMFTEILSCDLDLFEELFGVAGDLYRNAILPMAVAILLMILIWQLFKSMFGKAGVSAEDPVELILRSCICLFMVFFAKDIANYILEIAGTPYQWVVGTSITVTSFSEYVSALEVVTDILGVGTLSIQILMLIMHIVVAWNYFKMLFILAERYVLLGVFAYTSPLAFATGGAKSTNNILASWAKMFGGQVVVVILDAWCVKMFLSAYGNMSASSYGFTKFFAATLCLVGFCKITSKLDSYMGSLGVNLGRITSGLSGLGALMMAGRFMQMGSRGFGGSHGNGGQMNFGGGGPIPLRGNPGMPPGGSGMSASGIGGDGGIPHGNGDMQDIFGSGRPDLDSGNLPFGMPETDTKGTPAADGFGSGDLSFGVSEMDTGGVPIIDGNESGNLPFGEMGGMMEDVSAADLGTDDFGMDSLPGMEMPEGGPFGMPYGGMEDMALGDLDRSVVPPADGDSGLPKMAGSTDASWDPENDWGLDDYGSYGAGEFAAGIAAGEAPDGIAMGTDGKTEQMSGAGFLDSSGYGSMEAGSDYNQTAGYGRTAPVGSNPGGGITDDLKTVPGNAGSVTDGSGFAGRGETAGSSGILTAAAGSPGAAGVPVSGKEGTVGFSDSWASAAGSAAVSHGGFSQAPGGTAYEAAPAGAGRHFAGAEPVAVEREGQSYLRYDANLYQKPKGSYQSIHENGRTYYEVPEGEHEQPPARLSDVKAVLGNDGTIHLKDSRNREKPSVQQRQAPEPSRNGTEAQQDTSSLPKGSASGRSLRSGKRRRNGK